MNDAQHKDWIHDGSTIQVAGRIGTVRRRQHSVVDVRWSDGSESVAMPVDRCMPTSPGSSSLPHSSASSTSASATERNRESDSILVDKGVKVPSTVASESAGLLATSKQSVEGEVSSKHHLVSGLRPVTGGASACRVEGSPCSRVPKVHDRVCETLEAILIRLEALATDRVILQELQGQCRAYTEQLHVNEIILPLARCLIGVADRCRQGTAEYREIGQRTNDSKVRNFLSLIIDARHADRVEIEELLHILGVESFCSVSDQFDPALHKCINRIHTSVPEAQLTIARRHLPGYRRGELLVRPEYVSVYVFASHQPSNT